MPIIQNPKSKIQNRAIRVHTFGTPEEVARLESIELQAIQPNQVRIAVKAAPINPADLNVLEGTYGTKPPLPFIAGNEGVGIIVETGSAVRDLTAGQMVVAPLQRGWWCTERILDAATVYPVSGEAAATLTINPPTAYRMLRDFVKLEPGDWIVQNAANSMVGRCVIQIARQHGWHTVNVVRRPELIPELEALGGDIVVTDEKPLSKQINVPAKLGLNAVGGESARQVAKSLAPHGTLVTYGAMSRQPVTVENGLLIFKDIRFCGFWISDWYRQAGREEISAMLRELEALPAPPVEKTYPLEQVADAIRHARQDKRGGKILLVMK
jgi:mitochondrial enoyl-[acyl-carrier protein] reductase / trans-2-enoyl-CoA reductase